MEKKELFKCLKQQCETIVKKYDDINKVYTEIVGLLDKCISYYHWTGIYLMDGNSLELGPFIGKPTEHERIEVSQGICGQAAALKDTIIVDDVSEEGNYLACSLETRSEIVVPIMVGDKVVGEIDVDSDQLDAFDELDAELLEHVAELIAAKLNQG